MKHRFAQHIPAFDIVWIGPEKGPDGVDGGWLPLVEQAISDEQPPVSLRQPAGAADGGSDRLMGLLAAVAAGPAERLRPPEMGERKGRIGLYGAGVRHQCGIPVEPPIEPLALEIRAKGLEGVGGK